MSFAILDSGKHPIGAPTKLNKCYSDEKKGHSVNLICRIEMYTRVNWYH